jgi:hypothetical protein
MAINKMIITPENSAEWLASCGFLFPTNERELTRFNKLYGNIDPTIAADEVDPFKIIKSSAIIVKLSSISKQIRVPDTHYQMVAKKISELPKHIADKMKKNQENKTNNMSYDEE